MSWAQWRANRLVDLLAKAAATRARLPKRLFEFTKAADTLHTHLAARLGMVTYAATNFERTAYDAHGKEIVQVVRDSAGQRPQWPRTWRRFPPQQLRQQVAQPTAAASSGTSTAPAAGPTPRTSPPLTTKEKRRRLTECHLQQQRVSSARQVANHLAATSLAPTTSPPACDRMAALRDRIRAREREAEDWESERREASRLD